VSDGLVEQREIVLADPDRPVLCGLYDREALGAGQVVSGPATISEYASTTLLHEGDVLTVSESGELIIRLGGSSWTDQP
jgi:N-methylhydantoinase A/oxoprolinase/acetone carboxylase beta subunit